MSSTPPFSVLQPVALQIAQQCCFPASANDKTHAAQLNATATTIMHLPDVISGLMLACRVRVAFVVEVPYEFNASLEPSDKVGVDLADLAHRMLRVPIDFVNFEVSAQDGIQDVVAGRHARRQRERYNHNNYSQASSPVNTSLSLERLVKEDPQQQEQQADDAAVPPHSKEEPAYDIMPGHREAAQQQQADDYVAAAANNTNAAVPEPQEPEPENDHHADVIPQEDIAAAAAAAASDPGAAPISPAAANSDVPISPAVDSATPISPAVAVAAALAPTSYASAATASAASGANSADGTPSDMPSLEPVALKAKAPWKSFVGRIMREKDEPDNTYVDTLVTYLLAHKCKPPQDVSFEYDADALCERCGNTGHTDAAMCADRAKAIDCNPHLSMCTIKSHMAGDDLARRGCLKAHTKAERDSALKLCETSRWKWSTDTICFYVCRSKRTKGKLHVQGCCCVGHEWRACTHNKKPSILGRPRMTQ
jgi:hypothetical protein